MCLWCVFFFKQKTAYEMRISDWSSDVCSSDLRIAVGLRRGNEPLRHQLLRLGYLSKILRPRYIQIEAPMFDWLKDIVFRTTVLREILELSGQIKPSRGRQIVYGLCIAYPYIVFSVFIFMVGFATYIRTRTEIYILLSGIGISFVALLYGLFVSPSRGGVPIVRNFVKRNQKNNIRTKVVIDKFPSTLDSIERQISMLNVIDRKNTSLKS